MLLFLYEYYLDTKRPKEMIVIAKIDCKTEVVIDGEAYTVISCGFEASHLYGTAHAFDMTLVHTQTGETVKVEMSECVVISHNDLNPLKTLLTQ